VTEEAAPEAQEPEAEEELPMTEVTATAPMSGPKAPEDEPEPEPEATPGPVVEPNPIESSDEPEPTD